MHKRTTLFTLFTFFFFTNCFTQVDPNKYMSAGDLFEKGTEYFIDGSYSKAYDEFMKVNENDTAFFDSRINAVESASKGDYFDTVINLSQEVLRIKGFNPHRERFLNYVVYANNQLDRYEEAITHIDEALNEFPRSSMIRYNKAVALYNLDRFDESVTSLQDAIRFNPRSYNAHLLLGAICAEAGDYTKAALSLNMAIYLNAGNESVLSAITLLESLYSGEVEETLSNLNYREEEDFDEIDLMIKNKLPENKNYKVKLKLNYRFMKYNHLLFDQISYDEDNEGFWNQNYVRFFKELSEKGEFANFSYYQCLKVDDSKTQSVISKYKSKIISFLEWANEYMTTCFNERTVYENGEYVQNNLIHKGTYGFSEEGELSNGKFKGPYASYTETGLLEGEGQFNDEGVFTGEWAFYENGVKNLKVNFNDNGKMEGDRISYYKNGSRKDLTPVKNERIDGKQILYFACNQPYSETPYNAEGKEDGVQLYFFKSGGISKKVTYKDGTLHGPYEYYFIGNKLREKVNYVDGKKEGEFIGYHYNGQVQTIGQYEDDEPVGHWKYYHDNGKLDGEGDYKNGYRVGIWKQFNRNGVISEETNYGETGKKTGIYKEYDLDGNLIMELEYKGEEINSYKNFDPDGNILSEGVKKKKTLDFVNYHENGVKSVEGQYEKGESVGSWKYYNLHGILTTELMYDSEGLMNGESKWYFDNGKIETIKHYKDDELDGYFVDYYRNDQIFQHGWYQEGRKVGSWEYFYRDGTIKSREYYLEGEVHGYADHFDAKGRIYETSTFFFGTNESTISYDTLGNITNVFKLKDGKGTATYTDCSGTKSLEKEYSGAMAHGKVTGYHENGKVSMKGQYLAGYKQGIWQWFDEEGRLESEGVYSDSKKDSVWRWYFADGTTEVEKWYDDGELKGTATTYYKNGNKRNEKNYRNGERHGTCTYYDVSGEIEYIRYYDDGLQLGYSYLGKDGKFVEMIPFDGMNGKMEAYFKSGKKSYYSEYKDGYSHGITTHYHTNGKVRLSINYVMDQFTGEYTEYFANGQLKEKAEYYFGQQNGLSATYFENGKPKSTEYYIMGDKYGSYKYFNSNGTVESSGHYYFNRKIN